MAISVSAADPAARVNPCDIREPPPTGGKIGFRDERLITAAEGQRPCRGKRENNATGAENVSLQRIPAGAYLIEARIDDRAVTRPAALR